MTAPPSATGVLAIRRLRGLLLTMLIVGVAVFTGVMLTLVHSLSERFGPQVAADLEWRALRGAQELSRAADLGLAVSDKATVEASFGAYVSSSDVRAIVAIDAHGDVVANHGEFSDFARIFAVPPGTLARGDGYVASWAPAVIEGNQVGKIAVVVSTARLVDARSLLAGVSRTTLIAGLTGALLGALLVVLFSRAIAARDQRLHNYAQNLERMVEARTQQLDDRNRSMRLVLDNVAQGFVTIDLDGVMASERSAILDRWFGEPAPGMTFGSYIQAHDPGFAAWFDLGLESLRADWLPVDLCLAQMQGRFSRDGRTFDITYSPISTGGQLARLLLIVSDVTAQLARERSEREQREIVTLFQRITADRAGFDELLDDASELVGSLRSPGDRVSELRTLHTLKGNCASYGLEAYAGLCHEIETELAETSEPLSADQRAKLTVEWRQITERITQLIGDSRCDLIAVDLAELSRMVDSVRQGLAGRELAAALVAWSHEPVARRFERLARDATRLARRLEKGELQIAISDQRLRLDSARWAGFWSAMIHAVRNAVDHGIEPPAVRAAAGKLSPPTLSFTASRSHGELIIEVSDDGGGIRWNDVRARALALQLPAESQRDLEAALFADGVSTASSATEVSGRGVGMAALRAEVVALGGTIEIESEPGAGTTIRCRFHEVDRQLLALRSPTVPIRRQV